MRFACSSQRLATCVFALAVVALARGTEAQEPSAPIAVRVTTTSAFALDDTRKGLEAVAHGVEEGLVSERWARLVPAAEEMLVTIHGLGRSEGSRHTDKKGKVTIQLLYSASATVDVGGQSREVHHQHSVHVNQKSYVPLLADPRNFGDVGNRLAWEVVQLVAEKLDLLRPDRPQPGFAHEVKFKLLFKPDGLEVTAVEAGSPAARAGLQVGDRIRKIDGEQNTDKMAGRARTWWVEPAGTRVQLEVERNKLRQTIEVTLLPRRRWVESGQANR